MNRTIPVDGLSGIITIDISGDESRVVLPENVTVERRDASLEAE
ncbi:MULTISPECIES: hypothetical protein [unclassified Haladaptatus]|nr:MULTISPECIES: hypothetical protein [unclassified Haladaptatus]